ncbi:MAG: hypothetical protein HY362_04705 [Candidatus Aenigmarchaeota archaeon]|nr:hypothetical protein [Candidatus Aenigmarchaeota archaeon]
MGLLESLIGIGAVIAVVLIVWKIFKKVLGAAILLIILLVVLKLAGFF